MKEADAFLLCAYMKYGIISLSYSRFVLPSFLFRAEIERDELTCVRVCLGFFFQQLNRGTAL